MRLIITGCEYSGTSTLAKNVAGWIEETLGPPIPQGMPPFHDHFAFPDIGHGDLTEEEYVQVNALSPKLKAMIQNHQIMYHLNDAFYADHDNIMVGFHIEDAVYGPLYYDYGHDGSRSAIGRNIENHIMKVARDTVLVLLKASPEAIAKRLIDYGLHAPTVSFPVIGTLMIEPTESEPKEELDRFVDALVSIHAEIQQVEMGTAHATDNVLKNAPHTAAMCTADEWVHAYSRSQAAYPTDWTREFKFWPPVRRVDNAYGDRNLVCSCPPVEAYAEGEAE